MARARQEETGREGEERAGRKLGVREGRDNQGCTCGNFVQEGGVDHVIFARGPCGQ